MAAFLPRIGDIPQHLSPKKFWALFGHLEHAGLDFKRGVPADIRDTIAAMAMTHGGLIVHGVDDRRALVGCPLSQNTQDRITRIATECGVDVQLRPLVVGDVELTICAVPEVRGRIVTTPDGRLLRRVGGDSQPLRGDAMGRFVREREHRAGEDEPVARVDLTVFDLTALNQALTADGRPAVVQDGLERALTDLGVAVSAAPPLGLRVLRAALVLFASEPREYVRGAAVQLVRREGVGPGPGPSTSAREECAGPLAAAVDCCLRFVAAHTRRFETVVGTRRQPLPEYPDAVLREAIVNALAHRDYGLTGATVDITVWDDRIEVRSPGSLPGHITLDNMRVEHYSRNPVRRPWATRTAVFCRRSRSYSRNASSTLDCVPSAFPRATASTIAWAAPWPVCGSTGCAPSPSSVTMSLPQNGSGSRSTISSTRMSVVAMVTARNVCSNRGDICARIAAGSRMPAGTSSCARRAPSRCRCRSR